MKKLPIISLLFICSVIGFLSCSNDDSEILLPISCDKLTWLGPEIPDTLSSIDSVDNVEIENNCISITATYTGCPGKKLYLVDQDIIIDTSPLQRIFKLYIGEAGECDAINSVTESFDLTPIQLSGTSSIELNIEGWTSSGGLFYNY